jgi:hypothetical protein
MSLQWGASSSGLSVGPVYSKASQELALGVNLTNSQFPTII